MYHNGGRNFDTEVCWLTFSEALKVGEREVAAAYRRRREHTNTEYRQRMETLRKK